MTEPFIASIESLPDLVALVIDVPELLLRYSKGPAADAAGPSLDYEANVPLPGLSVTTLGTPPWWTRPPIDWVARRVCKYVGLTRGDDRRPWVLTGTVVGSGPDHEPLVVNVVPVAWLSEQVVRQAGKHYAEQFDVGRDSIG